MRCAPDCARLAVVCTRMSSGSKGQDAVCYSHEECQAGYACVRPLEGSGGISRCLKHCGSNNDCDTRGNQRCVEMHLTCTLDDPTQTIAIKLCQIPPPQVRRDGGP
jgi:hypothetical protein